MNEDRRRRAIRLQADYYLMTGLWPLVSMRAFEAITGPKTDRWLVKMVGLLAAAIGATLSAGLRSPRLSSETLTLSATSALAFATVDVVYALRGRISKIYLADAVLEAALLVSLR